MSNIDVSYGVFESFEPEYGGSFVVCYVCAHSILFMLNVAFDCVLLVFVWRRY